MARFGASRYALVPDAICRTPILKEPLPAPAAPVGPRSPQVAGLTIAKYALRNASRATPSRVALEPTGPETDSGPFDSLGRSQPEPVQPARIPSAISSAGRCSLARERALAGLSIGGPSPRSVTKSAQRRAGEHCGVFDWRTRTEFLPGRTTSRCSSQRRTQSRPGRKRKRGQWRPFPPLSSPHLRCAPDHAVRGTSTFHSQTQPLPRCPAAVGETVGESVTLSACSSVSRAWHRSV